jgi:integrase/recombinase XerD
MLEEL